uniref:Uncharacterized protein n=1 Tax=Odontella aurita TaxID=265563 RepID=A0A7S4JGA6_9STRA
MTSAGGSCKPATTSEPGHQVETRAPDAPTLVEAPSGRARPPNQSPPPNSQIEAPTPNAGIAQHGIPVSPPLRPAHSIPQNRLSPYVPGSSRERSSSSSSLDRRAIAPGGRGGGSRSFGHSQSSPPLSGGRTPRGRSRVVPSVGSYPAGVGGAVVMPMIPNLTPGKHLPVTPPCTPIGVSAKICGASLAAAMAGTGSGIGGAPVSPSVMRARQKAMENATETERARAKELEEREKSIDADQLRVQLKRERAHSAKLAADLAGMWSSAGLSQAEAEVYEEGRINNLMRRLDCLQREKGRIILELEREEEMVGYFQDMMAIFELGPSHYCTMRNCYSSHVALIWYL